MLHLLVTWGAWRNILSVGNVALSMLLGLLALGFTAIYYEETLLLMLKQAAHIRDWLVTFKTWPKAEIIARLVLHESSILLMFFTIGARIVVSFITWLIGFIFRP
jgi:hypothetical protein